MTDDFCTEYGKLNFIGQGQYGRVFCAIHQQSGKIVALKKLEQRSLPTHKFIRELYYLATLQHPNIVTFQGLKHTPNGRYIVMDYCAGGSLRNLIESGEKINLVYSLNLCMDILSGLAHAHSQDVIHCDIKPENILLSLDKDRWIARISDFGLARANHEFSTENQICMGSPAYMAPERFYGKFSSASDLYAVGIILYELIVGYRPFSGLPNELMLAHLNKPIEIPNTVPFLLRSLITKALQKLPVRRFNAATDMLKALKLAADVEAISQGETSPLIIPNITSLNTDIMPT